MRGSKRMDERFDDLSRILARGISRRAALRQVGGGLAGITVASLLQGHASASAGDNSACAHFCDQAFPPGPQRGQCKSDAAHDAGVCYQCGPAAPANNGLIFCNGTCAPACPGGQLLANGTCQTIQTLSVTCTPLTHTHQ